MSRREWRACAAKTRFRTDHEAHETIKHARRNPRGPIIPIRAYYCDRCDGYHLTSKEIRR